MNVPVYLGDELSAAGYRLAGAAVCTPPAGGEAAALQQALARSPLVLVSAPVAAAIGAGTMRAALSATAPLVLIVPDLRGEVPLPDLAGRLRDQLGLQA